VEGRIPARLPSGAAPEPYLSGVMEGLVRRHLLPLICFALAGLIGISAIADHRWKQARINRAELSEWYCTHRGTRCGGPSSEAIERHWNQRQVAYEVVVILLGGGALAWSAVREARRAR
jgi:hypothetical protein